jgi:hypothetical protein
MTAKFDAGVVRIRVWFRTEEAPSTCRTMCEFRSLGFSVIDNHLLVGLMWALNLDTIERFTVEAWDENEHRFDVAKRIRAYYDEQRALSLAADLSNLDIDRVHEAIIEGFNVLEEILDSEH